MDLWINDTDFDFITRHENKFGIIEELEKNLNHTINLMDNIPNGNPDEYLLNEIMFNYTNFMSSDFPNHKKQANFYNVKL